jgi:DNA invertase Pin-like site-specific DNA recombinase
MNQPHLVNQLQSHQTTNGKIQGHHRDRLVIVYIRQSTLQQVERHSESTKRQYGLVEKAYELGWSADNVLVIDEDLGRSGASAEGRPGFQRLVAEVGLDRVGMVLGIEMSRLARSCRDWYQLLEVCALFRTLIGDADGIYDPASHNDRLLLGLKGTMSEAELYVLKQRMLEGKKAKARRGELRIPPPMGYVRRPSGEVIKEPDEQAQSTIKLLFDLFERFSTKYAVLCYLVKHKIKLPCREPSGPQKGELIWRKPSRNTITNILHNPIYAGAYVYGRRPVDLRKKKAGRPSTGRTVAKQADWAVLIKDKLPAYITWEQYERNQRQLAANSMHGIGVTKKGYSLLSGLIICGRCGLRMTTHYTNSGSKLRYACIKATSNYAEKRCQSLVGEPLDELIVRHTLEALKPSALEVSLKMAEDLQQERKNLQTHWQKQLERAKYEVDRAYRQYNAIEPENRLVARTLEKKWEEALCAEEKIKRDYAKFLADQPIALTCEEREAIQQLASDIPALWSASSTTSKERKEILRLLIDRIIVTIEGNTEKVYLEIYWAGGYQTQSYFSRPVATFEQLSYFHELIKRAVSLREEGNEFREIAKVLNQEGWKTPQNALFNVAIVGRVLSYGGIASQKKTQSTQVQRMKHELTFQELSQQTNISQSTLYSWMHKGELRARYINNISHKGIWLISADEEEIKRLQSLKAKSKEWIYHSRITKVN